jgi:hypothetical protein
MSIQHTQTKAAVSVTEMARMVGLSRARFYQLMGSGTFPAPSCDPETGRPYFTEEQQRACLEVRRRNVGIDGKPALFYAPRSRTLPPLVLPRSKPHPPAPPHADLLDVVKALGLASATSAQVEAAVAESYPQGTEGIDPSEIIRAVFLSLKEGARCPAGGRCPDRAAIL